MRSTTMRRTTFLLSVTACGKTGAAVVGEAGMKGYAEPGLVAAMGPALKDVMVCCRLALKVMTAPRLSLLPQ
jgi:hypothetical protein